LLRENAAGLGGNHSISNHASILDCVVILDYRWMLLPSSKEGYQATI
jgi:hypothetical protein